MALGDADPAAGARAAGDREFAAQLAREPADQTETGEAPPAVAWGEARAVILDLEAKAFPCRRQSDPDRASDPPRNAVDERVGQQLAEEEGERHGSIIGEPARHRGDRDADSAT